MASVLVRARQLWRRRPLPPRCFSSSEADRRAVSVTLLFTALAAGLLAANPPGSDLQPDLRTLLTGDLKFSSEDLADLEHGKVVKHSLPASAPGEVAAVGGVRVRASKDRFAGAYRDIVGFKKNASVLEIGRFSNPPQLSDLDALTITHDDFDLRECRVGVTPGRCREPAKNTGRGASAR